MNIYKPVRLQSRQETIAKIAESLERTGWGRGIYQPGRIVPAARPAQIRAGAKKLYDVLNAQMRRAQEAGAK